jgi:hypothetical protein
MRLPNGAVVTSNYSGLAKLLSLYNMGAMTEGEHKKFRKRALMLGWNANRTSLSDISFIGVKE